MVSSNVVSRSALRRCQLPVGTGLSVIMGMEQSGYVSLPGVGASDRRSSPIVIRVVMMVGARRRPWAVGTRGRGGSNGGRSPSLVEGGGGELSLSSLIIWLHGRHGHEGRPRRGTPGWTVGVPRQPFGGGAVGMNNLVSYDGVLI